MNVLKVLKEGTKKLSNLFEDKEEGNEKVKEEKPQEVKAEVRKEVEMEQEKSKPEVKKEETKPEIKEETEKKIEEPKPAVEEEPKKETMQKAKTQQQDKTTEITQTGMPTKEDVMKVLEGVNDPEINIDVVTLELIYNVEVVEDKANIKMTFTTPMCPYGPMLVEEIKSKVRELNGIKDVNVNVVFDPPWQPSKELRATLGA